MRNTRSFFIIAIALACIGVIVALLAFPALPQKTNSETPPAADLPAGPPITSSEPTPSRPPVQDTFLLGRGALPTGMQPTVVPADGPPRGMRTREKKETQPAGIAKTPAAPTIQGIQKTPKRVAVTDMQRAKETEQVQSMETDARKPPTQGMRITDAPRRLPGMQTRQKETPVEGMGPPPVTPAIGGMRKNAEAQNVEGMKTDSHASPIQGMTRGQ